MSEISHDSTTTTPVRSEDLALLCRRKNNSELTINRLPAEILSYILLVGVEFDRKVWRWESQNIQSQHIASHVCSHWREVAIGTPSLWTFIHILGPPAEHTALFIARSEEAPLDILVDMLPLVPYPNFPYDPIRGVQPTSGVLRFLTTHGAGVHRWRSFFARFPESDLLPTFINFLNDNSPTGLRLLRFECANWIFHNPDGSHGSLPDGELVDIHQVHNKPCTLLGSSLPKLTEIELISIAGPYVYMPTPIAATHTLRTLSISPGSPYSVDLTNLLSSNPQLESLYLQTGYYYGGEPRLDRPDRDLIRPVVLPFLRSLYLNAVDNAQWVLHMLSAIKAPVLHHLTIQSFNQFTFGGEQREKLVSYLAGGAATLDYSASIPAYLSIKSFNIFHFPCRKKEFVRLMGSLPQLTHLTARRKQAEWLGEESWMLPKLESLEVPQLTPESATRILRMRAEAGAHIPLIKVQGCCVQLINQLTKIPGIAPEGHPKVTIKYEYYEYERDTKLLGDWHSIQQRTETFNKEHEDLPEYDLEVARRDEFFDGDDI